MYLSNFPTEKGFILSRHWRDTRYGVEVTYWLLTDTQPQKVTVPYQQAIGFLPESKLPLVRHLIEGQADISYRAVELNDQQWHHQRH